MKRNKSFLFLLIPFLLTSSVGAANKTKVRLKHKNQDLIKVKEALRKKKEEQQKLKKEETEITQNVIAKESKKQTIEKSLIYTRKKTTEVGQSLAQTKNQRDQIINNINENKKGFRHSARMYFASAQLAGASSMMSVYSRQMIRSQLMKDQKLKLKKDEVNVSLSEITGTYDLYQKELVNQEKSLVNLREGIKSQEKKLKKTRSKQDRVESELRELSKTAQELSGLIDVLRSKARKEAEKEKQARLQKAALGKSPIPAYSLDWPFRGTVVQKFGRQKHPRLGTPYISNGLTIQTGELQSIQAVSGGTVLFAGRFMSYGPMVVIEHPGDWYSVYGRMANWTVEKGQELKKGDVVGTTDITDTGKHQAYFELRFYGKATNPLPWLKK